MKQYEIRHCVHRLGQRLAHLGAPSQFLRTFQSSLTSKSMVYGNTDTCMSQHRQELQLMLQGSVNSTDCLMVGLQIAQERPSSSSLSHNCILGTLNAPNYTFIGHASMTRNVTQATRCSLQGTCGRLGTRLVRPTMHNLLLILSRS